MLVVFMMAGCDPSADGEHAAVDADGGGETGGDGPDSGLTDSGIGDSDSGPEDTGVDYSETCYPPNAVEAASLPDRLVGPGPDGWIGVALERLPTGGWLVAEASKEVGGWGVVYVWEGEVVGEQSLALADRVEVAAPDYSGRMGLTGVGTDGAFAVSVPAELTRFDAGKVADLVYAAPPDRRNSRHVAADDFDGDGLADLVITEEDEVAEVGWTALFSGAQSGVVDGPAAAIVEPSPERAGEEDCAYVGQGAVAIGDTDGDGLGDLALMECGGPGYAVRSRVLVFRDAMAARAVGDADLTFADQENVMAAGDADQDGLADVLIAGWDDAGERILTLQGASGAGERGDATPLASLHSVGRMRGLDGWTGDGSKVSADQDMNRDGWPDAIIPVPCGYADEPTEYWFVEGPLRGVVEYDPVTSAKVLTEADGTSERGSARNDASSGTFAIAELDYWGPEPGGIVWIGAWSAVLESVYAGER